MASLPQFWDWLENKRDKNNKVFREVWKKVETEAGKIGVAKAKRREETEREKEIGRKGAEEERKEEEPKKNIIIEVKKVVEK